MLFFVELVLKLSVAAAEQLVEFGLVSNCAKVERLARREYDSLLGKVAVVWVV